MLSTISILYGIVIAISMALGAYEGLTGLPAVTTKTKGSELADFPFMPGLLCILACIPLVVLGSLVCIPTVLVYVTCRNVCQPRKRDHQAYSQLQNTSEHDGGEEG